MRRFNLLPWLLCLCLLLSACGASAPAENNDMGGDFDRFYSESEKRTEAAFDAGLSPAETAPAPELSGESPLLTGQVQTDRKLIKTVHLEAETEGYDALLPVLEARIVELGGYIETRRTGSYSRQNRWSEMTIRIPADRLPEFLSHVQTQANVLSSSEDTRDVTLEYSDTEAKITALETEQARLLELLAGAQNLSEILEIEARLSDVTYELERFASRKRSYDNQITYATVTLNLREVKTLTPAEQPSVWQRITDGFAGSLSRLGTGLTDAFVWVIANSPFLVLWAAVLTAVALLLRKIRRKAQKRRQSPPSETP